MQLARIAQLFKQRLGRYFLPLLWLLFAFALIIYGLSEHVHFYVSVDQLLEQPSRYQNTQFRLGGFVVANSLNSESLLRSFQVAHKEGATVESQRISVVYKGDLPALFQEGKAMVADGFYDAGVFYAQNILAKHDEYYQVPMKP